MIFIAYFMARLRYLLAQIYICAMGVKITASLKGAWDVFGDTVQMV